MSSKTVLFQNHFDLPGIFFSHRFTMKWKLKICFMSGGTNEKNSGKKSIACFVKKIKD